MRFSPIDVVGHHEKVSAELHLTAHTAFVIGLLEHFDRRMPVIALFQAFLDFPQEQRGLIPAFRAVELRHARARRT